MFSPSRADLAVRGDQGNTRGEPESEPELEPEEFAGLPAARRACAFADRPFGALPRGVRPVLPLAMNFLTCLGRSKTLPTGLMKCVRVPWAVPFRATSQPAGSHSGRRPRRPLPRPARCEGLTG